MDEDMELINGILDGNLDNFDIIVNKYELSILRFVYNLIEDREAAEDITQEVFITVYNKLYTYKKEYKFSNWLFQIARNKSIDYIRRYKRVYEANIEDVIDIKSNEMSPEQSAEYMETKTLVEEFIRNISVTDRQIILLKYSNELTFSDIAEILEMNESSVKKKYYKNREKFKEFLANKEKREGRL